MTQLALMLARFLFSAFACGDVTEHTTLPITRPAGSVIGVLLYSTGIELPSAFQKISSSTKRALQSRKVA